MLARLPPLCIYGMSIFIYFWPPLLYSPNLYPERFVTTQTTHQNPQKPTKPTHETQKSHMKPTQNNHKIHTNSTCNPHETQTKIKRRVSFHYIFASGLYKGSTYFRPHFCVKNRNPWFFRPTEEPWQYVPIFHLPFPSTDASSHSISIRYLTIVGTHTPIEFCTRRGVVRICTRPTVREISKEGGRGGGWEEVRIDIER